MFSNFSFVLSFRWQPLSPTTRSIIVPPNDLCCEALHWARKFLRKFWMCFVIIRYGCEIADFISVIGAEAMIRQMSFKLPLVLSIVAAVFKDRADLVAENIALRHQLSCFIHRGPRPRLRHVDRVF